MFFRCSMFTHRSIYVRTFSRSTTHKTIVEETGAQFGDIWPISFSLFFFNRLPMVVFFLFFCVFVCGRMCAVESLLSFLFLRFLVFGSTCTLLKHRSSNSLQYFFGGILASCVVYVSLWMGLNNRLASSTARWWYGSFVRPSTGAAGADRLADFGVFVCVF